MSRTFHPPDTLSKDQIRTIADVRRDIWTSGFVGLGAGSVGGLAIHNATAAIIRRGWVKANISLNRNTAMTSFILGGALASFILAVTTGKNSVHRLHPIFSVGSTKEGETYANSIRAAKEKAAESDAKKIEEDIDPNKLQQNWQKRQKVLKQRMTEQTGISDSHGGHWLPEDRRHFNEKD